MIVNQHEEGWEVIYHRAHALLAAQIAGHWHPKHRPERVFETLAAISHHDDLEKEWEKDSLTPAGAPLDFTLEQEIDLNRLKELIESARYRGRWVTLLTSMHLSFLYGGKRGESAELDEFLDEQLKCQQAWRKALKINKDKTALAYDFFQFCDRLSLILCNRNLPAGERYLEIFTNSEGTRYDVLQRQDEKVIVQPWPFGEDSFTVNVEAQYLKQVTFKNNAELNEALKTAPVQALEWTFVKPQ
ncbi:MAG: DUF3891 family protein [Desertifilum sp.]|nr:DUF3891 family protein [Desertifilum sp.]MDI9639245.1 DUF3891 family protein [Geitlerinema splendidum]